MNKEGIFSLFGYVALYLISSGLCGNIVQEKKPRERREWVDTFLMFAVEGVVFVALGQLSSVVVQDNSRRLMNLSHVLVSVGLNLLVLNGCLAVNMFVSIFTMDSPPVPSLFEIINRNNLAVFLVVDLLISCSDYLLIAFVKVIVSDRPTS
eukprot:TRINITY_DN1552_c0_g1_i2.p1 TRINITY_DN1552_c0_g1~~TRINITY_DN1552_c0_g1_i2.p1  ORF type:complete len:151 (-),score=22.35 TRINITY_DN1552_c0_g1_i2:123-575(-)